MDTDRKDTLDKKYIVDVMNFFGHLEVGGVTEVRVLPKSRYTMIGKQRKFLGEVVSGYYDDYKKLADHVAYLDGKGGIYFTLNPCERDLLARAANRLQVAADVTTSDDEVSSDIWFPIDIDPIRPAGISSTSDELQAALNKLDEIAEFLSPWATVVKAMSGNGGHGLIRLIGYPNNEVTRRAKQSLTFFLSDRFSDPTVSVDNTVSNMSRIWKIYGTLACKGDSIPSRPYRRSYLEIEKVEPVDLYAHLDEIIPDEYKEEVSNKPDSVSGDYPFLNVREYLDSWGGEYRIKQRGNATWYQFCECPLHTDYDGHEWECGICQYESGKLGGKCMHDPAYGWQDFKAVLGDPKEFYVVRDVST